MVALSRRAVSIDSEIDRQTRTGRRTFQAIAATSGSIFTDALPPKPPPISGDITRTRLSRKSKIRASPFSTAADQRRYHPPPAQRQIENSRQHLLHRSRRLPATP